jgi:hypothetical protein
VTIRVTVLAGRIAEPTGTRFSGGTQLAEPEGPLRKPALSAIHGQTVYDPAVRILGAILLDETCLDKIVKDGAR